MKDVDSFSSKLQLALEKLGKSDALKPETSQDPADAELHEFFVAQTGESLFKKRKEAALKRLVVGPVAENAAKVAALTRKSDAKESATLVTGQHYTLTLETKKPARKTNLDKLKAILQTRHGFSAAQVVKLFEDCEEMQNPPMTYRANPVRG